MPCLPIHALNPTEESQRFQLLRHRSNAANPATSSIVDGRFKLVRNIITTVIAVAASIVVVLYDPVCTSSERHCGCAKIIREASLVTTMPVRPQVLVAATVMMGLCLVDLATNTKQHRYQERVFFGSLVTAMVLIISGCVLGSSILSSARTFIPATLVCGQLFDMALGWYVAAERHSRGATTTPVCGKILI